MAGNKPANDNQPWTLLGLTMSKPRLEERLEQLRKLKSATPDEAVTAALRKALGDRSNLIVAEAAKACGELHLSALIPDLLRSLERLFENPVKTDPKCWGKTAIVKALTQLEYPDSAPFVRGSRHVQMEPVWGGQEDAAIHLRAACVWGFVQCTNLRRTGILQHLVDAASDSADPVRLEAVRALEQMGGDEAMLLLRLKARLGDARPVVIGQVFDSLLRLEMERAVGFVAEHLNSSNDEIRIEAALALGGSRLPPAIRVLIETWNAARIGEFRAVLLRALSSSREESALEFLLNLVRQGFDREAAAALDALQLHETSPEIQGRIEAAKTERHQT